jgi:hypothetical protein
MEKEKRCPNCGRDEIDVLENGEVYCGYCENKWGNMVQYNDDCEPYLHEWELQDRIDATDEVLKDICHHVNSLCFATCKGDYSGNLPTSCLTYRIWDALHPKAKE